MKTVSVIVPIYNVEQYLEQCLDSLLAQTYPAIKVYLVNDGSKDGCQQIIDRYVKEYTDVFIALIKENGGLSSARNFGLQYVNTDYVMFLDSDDYVSANFVERLVNTAEETCADIVECGFYKIYEDGTKVLVKPLLSGVNMLETYPDVICEMTVTAWNKIYKTSLFKDNDIEYPYGLLYEDTATTPRLISRSKVICSIDDALLFYRQRKGSIMSSLDNRIFNLYDIEKWLYNDVKYPVFKEQFDCCRIDRIIALIGKMLISTGYKVEIMKAFHYLDTNIPQWQNNRIWNKRGNKSGIIGRIYTKLLKTKNYSALRLVHIYKTKRSISK